MNRCRFSVSSFGGLSPKYEDQGFRWNRRPVTASVGGALMMMLLIDSFAPHPDALESHKIEIAASPALVYRMLWTADRASAGVIKAPMRRRSFPRRGFHQGQRRRPPQQVTLHTLLEAGFEKLAEESGREIVLGVAGRFWRPLDNILPPKPEYFQ